MTSPIGHQDIKLTVQNFKECFGCNLHYDKSSVEIIFLNQKVDFCSVKCFKLYKDHQKTRRKSKEKYLTPHPNEIIRRLSEEKDKK